MQHINTLILISLFTAAAAGLRADDTAFIEGFPDVPLLTCCQEVNPENRVVFDVPAGIVAETTISSRESHGKTVEIYLQALSGLGWDCAIEDTRLTCDRSEHRLRLNSLKSEGDRRLFTLFIHPRDSQ